MDDCSKYTEFTSHIDPEVKFCETCWIKNQICKDLLILRLVPGLLVLRKSDNVGNLCKTQNIVKQTFLLT